MKKCLITRDWLQSVITRSPHSNFIISGHSGTGKTIISHQLSTQTNTKTLLTHHCTRFTPDTIDNLSTTLALALSRHFGLPKRSSFDTVLQSIRNQAAPKSATPKAHIIFDAIDEWLYQSNASQLLNFVKNVLIAHLSPHIQFIVTTRSNNLEPLQLGTDFFNLSLDFNDTEHASNPLNTNLVNDAIELIMMQLRSNKYLSNNIMSLMRSTTDASCRNLVNTIAIKSDTNLLFITKLFDFVKHQKLDLQTTVDAVPSTLNGLYLHMSDYLFDSYRILMDTNCVTSLPPSESMSSSWIFHKSFQSSREDHIDLFHFILGVAALAGADGVSREGFFERIQARFGDAVNEYLFELTFNLMEKVFFGEDFGLFHLSFAEFLTDVKFSTTRHCVHFGDINEIFVCFYWKKLLGVSAIDARYYAYLNCFKEYLIKCGHKEAVGDRLSEIYGNRNSGKRTRSDTKTTLNSSSTQSSDRNPIRRFFRNTIFKCCCPYSINSIDS